MPLIVEDPASDEEEHIVHGNPQLQPEWRKLVEECEQADAKLDETLARLRRERDTVLSPFVWGNDAWGQAQPISPHVKRVAEARYAREEQAARDEYGRALKAAETKLFEGLSEKPPPG